MRPEMIATGHSDGKPFYCGKTVKIPERRLDQHRHRRTSRVGARLQECGNFVRIKTVEIVPIEQDWIARERFWIRTLRLFHPDCLNVSDGGEGPAGVIYSAEVRARMSAAHLGKVNSLESIARGAAKRRGKKRTPEQIAKTAAGRRGKSHSLEARAKMRAAHLGKVIPPEQRAKMKSALRATLKGKTLSSEHRIKLVEAWERDRESRIQKLPSRLGIKHSPETRAKLRAAHLGRKLPEEQKTKIRESCRRTAAFKASLRSNVATVEK